MFFAAIDTVERLAELFAVPTESMQKFLVGVLLAGLVLASIHLLTMLVTRWGDRASTSKSLIFSVIVHLSCAFGVVAVSPSEPLAESPEEERIVVRNLVIESDDDVELDEQGNTPIWEKLPDPMQQPLTRAERTIREVDPPDGPERRPEPLTEPDEDMPDLQPMPDEPVAKPNPVELADLGPRDDAAPTVSPADEQTAEARPDVSQPAYSSVRKQIERPGMDDGGLIRQPNQGSVDRLDDQFDPTRQLAAIGADVDPKALLTKSDDNTTIKRSAGPAPVTMPSEEPGVPSDFTSDGSGGGSTKPPRFTRLPSRTGRRGSPISTDARRTPTTPEETPGDTVALRSGIETESPTAGLRPNIARPNIDPVRTDTDTSVPATYRLRNLSQREETAKKYGGTEASERAVEASLHWLATHQSEQGNWDAEAYGAGQVQIDEEGVDRMRAGIEADTGLTALAVLAFLGAGYTHEEGQYAEQVDRALRWLVRQQREDGYLGGNATRYAKMYCHGMATYALAEAYGMQSDLTADTWLRRPLQRAVAYIVDQQNVRDGGWRYLKGQQSDMSIFGWQLMALKSAEIAGIPMPPVVKSRMIQFLKDRSLGEDKGLAAYRYTDPPLPPTPSMTAEALFCKQMLGINRTNPASIEAVGFMMQYPPKRSTYNLYYWYYGTLAMYQYGGESWREWNESLRETLIADQRTIGDEAGSWDPKAPWGPYGGRVFSTALSTLCLEVYYRFLPLYQIGGQYTDPEG